MISLVPHFFSKGIPLQIEQVKSDFNIKTEIKYEEINYTDTELELNDSILRKNNLTETERGVTDEQNNRTVQEKVTAENNTGEDLLLRQKHYEKILGTREKLMIYLQRENLHELQRKCNDIERCSICSFVTKQNKIRVKYLALPVKTFPNCIYCGFRPKNREAIEKHIKNVHKIDMIKCKKCAYLGETVAQLKHHHHQRHTISQGITFHCHHCKYQTSKKNLIKRHCNIVHRELEEANTYRCHSCDFKTKYKGSIRNHVALHNPKRKMYQCDLCPFKTHKFRTLLESHKFKHETSEEAKIYKCPLCPHKTKAMAYLDKHMLVHKKADEAVRQYKCDVCSFQTVHCSSLGRHMEIHAPKKEKWIPCELCPYKAKDKTFYDRHMLTHKKVDEVEVFKCGRCSFKTKYRSSMIRHAQNHKASNGTHPCKFCSYKGKTATHLKQHERMHVYNEDAKMHMCEQCPYKCRNLANMKKHYIAHKNLKKLIFFPCKKCKYQAVSRKWLKAHCDNVHKIHDV